MLCSRRSVQYTCRSLAVWDLGTRSSLYLWHTETSAGCKDRVLPSHFQCIFSAVSSAVQAALSKILFAKRFVLHPRKVFKSSSPIFAEFTNAGKIIITDQLKPIVSPATFCTSGYSIVTTNQTKPGSKLYRASFIHGGTEN